MASREIPYRELRGDVSKIAEVGRIGGELPSESEASAQVVEEEGLQHPAAQPTAGNGANGETP